MATSGTSYNKEKLQIISLIRNIYLCSKYKPPSLEKPSKSKSEYGSYKNPMADFELLDNIASVIKQSLFEELNSSLYWSLMIDETNSIEINCGKICCQ